MWYKVLNVPLGITNNLWTVGSLSHFVPNLMRYVECKIKQGPKNASQSRASKQNCFCNEVIICLYSIQ